MSLLKKFYLTRESIASMYIEGDGIEIGALYDPLKVPASARIKYIDERYEDELLNKYCNCLSPEQKNSLVKVDIIDDGHKLSTIEDGSQDFVIANHFLEHCQNPILAITNMIRVLKKHGILFLTVPDKRYSKHDINNEITTLEHVIRDYTEGGEVSRRKHIEDYIKIVEGEKNQCVVDERTEFYIKNGIDIHYHSWTQTEMLEIMLYLKKKLGFEIELIFKSGRREVFFILRKSDLFTA